jgi:hypothetical protein
MDWVTALLVLAMFTTGYTLGRTNSELRGELAHRALHHFHQTVRRDMRELPRGPFEQSHTVRLVRNDGLFDWLQEGEA